MGRDLSLGSVVQRDLPLGLTAWWDLESRGTGGTLGSPVAQQGLGSRISCDFVHLVTGLTIKTFLMSFSP